MRRSIAVTGPATPDQAWEGYAVLTRWSTWAPPIRHVEASADRIAAGVTGVVHGVGGLRVVFEIESVDEVARRWTWRVRVGPVRVRFDHAVLESPDGGSVATLTVDGPGPVVLVYPELARVALTRLVR